MFRCVMCLILTCLPSLSAAQSFAPGEHAYFPLPNGFELAFTAEDGDVALQEYVPMGESVEDWSQMLTFRIFRSLGGQSAEDFHGRLVQAVISNCDGAEAQVVAQGEEIGTPFHVVFVGCPLSPVTGGEEWFLSKAMAGRDAMYLVQGAWRGAPTPELVQDWSAFLAQVAVCDTRRADAPCPG